LISTPASAKGVSEIGNSKPLFGSDKRHHVESRLDRERIGAFSATAVIDLGGMMILGMAFPNIIGLVMFWELIRRDLDGDWARYRRGEFERVK